MILQIMWVSLLMVLVLLWPVAATTRSDVKPGCQEKCGNVSVPYPFGILEPSCAMNKNFFLNCTSNDEGHPQLLFGRNMPISNISELEGTVTVRIYAAFSCYNKKGIETDFYSTWMTLGSGPFMFSNTRNIFTAIGCDTSARVTNFEFTYGATCLSLCTEYVEMSDANPCSGSGCCQTSIPKGLNSLNFSLSTYYMYKNVSDFNRCGFAFLADNRSFKLSDWPLSRTPIYGNDGYATDVVIEWVVENKTCEQAKANTSAYACRTNAYCTDPEIDQGYRCSCNEGFEGNPYLQEGCQGYALLSLVIYWSNHFPYNNLSSTLHDVQKKRKGEKLQETRGNSFKAPEMKKFKGVDKAQMNEEFQKEMGVISQVNHKNVVKLLGLCLETRVPLLVYEFISNGTLYQHIHDKTSRLLASWSNRLRIASEIALALNYLHSLADPPIIHGDVKSVNILLDNKYTAKIADFGASILLSTDKTIIVEKIQGTLGYLDPEYLMTGILTVQSDVYSFGVVLVELLTGEKPNSISSSGQKRNIIQHFISALGTNNLFKILDFQAADEGEMDEIEAVAELAKACLNSMGVNRPTIKEVSDELAKLSDHNQKSWTRQNNDETDSLLGETSQSPRKKADQPMTPSQNVISFQIENYTDSI
ncbi:hypothetical protein DKX38_006545 [Salix brachista]|uniref:Protein kinase domain-containing protein n=1 Tax=Salix brachista TaxID=2182728 RepID=A0A5N5N3M4_9ROSI|nr:hypothetical protein DKX38_006545 [Salix brachista]